MPKKQATIKNNAGIHLRPSGLIAQAIRGFTGSIILRNGRAESELHTVIDIVYLGLKKGDAVEIEITGDGAEALLPELVRLFETEFDFPREKEAI